MSSRLQLTAVWAMHQLSLHHHRDHHDGNDDRDDYDGDDRDDDDDDSDISCIMIIIAIMMVTMMDMMVMIMRTVVSSTSNTGQACGQARAGVVNMWQCLHLGDGDADDGDDAMCQRARAV